MTVHDATERILALLAEHPSIQRVERLRTWA
jgi:hypothetical protein